MNIRNSIKTTKLKDCLAIVGNTGQRDFLLCIYVVELFVPVHFTVASLSNGRNVQGRNYEFFSGKHKKFVLLVRHKNKGSTDEVVLHHEIYLELYICFSCQESFIHFKIKIKLIYDDS